MASVRAIFFDVGNTLLFPDRARILAPLPAGAHPSLAEWQALERRTKVEFDRSMQEGLVDHAFWWIFHTHLLEQLNALTDGVRDDLIRNTQDSRNWNQMLAGTREALMRFAENFSTAVISNADGKIEGVLRSCGIADCFESITDSGIVGKEKPHPDIFRAALEKMKAKPEESLYVGDVYSVDYLGATNVGMQGVLFDIAGTYRESGLPRVESLAELENRLKR